MSEEIDFLDSLEPDPPRVVQPAPAVVPVPVVAVPTKSRERLRFGAILAVVFVCAFGSALAMSLWLSRSDTPTPGDYDPRFVSVGKAYLGDLGPAYASAWEDGAKVLDAGQTVDMALDTVAKAWETNRKAAFNKRLTPELSKVVEQGKEATSEERAVLAKAYRGLRKGLGGK